MDTKKMAQALRLLADALEADDQEPVAQPIASTPAREPMDPLALRKMATDAATKGHRAAVVAHLGGKKIEQLTGSECIALEDFLRGLA